MVRPRKALRSKSMQLFKMLPKMGMFYSFWKVSLLSLSTPCQETMFSNTVKPNEDETNKTNNERRILPPNISTKIMIKFNHKSGKGTTRNDFDRDVAQLFSNAEKIVRSAGYHGQDPSAFWHVPKRGTFLEFASDNTVSRFTEKILQARENGLEKQAEMLKARAIEMQKQGQTTQAIEQELQNQRDIFQARDCQTAKAVDGFNRAMEVASIMSGGASALMEAEYKDATTIPMALYTSMTNHFADSDDTDASEADDQPTDNDEEPTDDESPATKRVKIDEPCATDGEARPSFAADLGNNPLTIRTRAPKDLGGPDKTNAKEPVMSSTNNGEATANVAPTVGIDWSDNMDRDTHVKWYWANKNSKPSSYYDELFARSAEDSEMDYEVDDQDMDLDM